MKIRFLKPQWFKKISKRELILAGITLAVVTAFLAESAVRAIHRDFSQIDTRIRERETTLFAYKRILTNEQQLRKRHADTIKHYTELADSDQLLRKIGTLAAERNINIIHMKPSQPRDEGNYRSYTVRVRAQDDIERFSAFLYSLTDELQRVGVRRLQIRGQNDQALPVIDLELTALAFKK